MIYSEDINRVCGLCVRARRIAGDDEGITCLKKHKVVPVTNKACRSFKYDILKKQVRRQRKLKTHSPTDFSLE